MGIQKICDFNHLEDYLSYILYITKDCLCNITFHLQGVNNTNVICLED